MQNLDIVQNKIVDLPTLKRKIETWKFLNKKIVFTNGCFDLLHLGHINLINKSSELGDFLIIGLNTDASIKKIKGNNRPIQNEKNRLTVLASLMFVSLVVLFNEETPLNLIQTIRPDIITKGADYKINEIVGGDFIKSYGGKILTIDYLDGNSTSLIESRIKNRAKC